MIVNIPISFRILCCLLLCWRPTDLFLQHCCLPRTYIDNFEFRCNEVDMCEIRKEFSQIHNWTGVILQ